MASLAEWAMFNQRAALPQDPPPNYPEWDEPRAGGGVRQGDVLQAVAEDMDQWHQLLVVITADCDLANAKHGGSLTCVPIIRLFDYLVQFRTEKTRVTLLQRLVAAVLGGIHRPGPQGSEHRITPQRMVGWLREVEPEEILDELSDWSIDERVPELLGLAGGLIQPAGSDLATTLQVFARVKVILGDAGDLEKARASLANELAASLRNLPGDVLLLNEVSANHSEGYAVYLRRVMEITEAAVATSYYRIPHSAQYVRVSCLKSPYRYALTQQFGSVFSAIGLPAAYEAARDTIGVRIKSGEY